MKARKVRIAITAPEHTVWYTHDTHHLPVDEICFYIHSLSQQYNKTMTKTPHTANASSAVAHRKALQAQPIRSLRTHSAASLRSSLDGEELGSEKLKALVEKFKHDVEQQGNDDDDDDDKDHTNLSIEDDSDDDDDDKSDESTTESAPPRAAVAATTRAAVVATNEQVRSKFINRLGIQSSVVPPEANPRRAAIPREPSYELPLNDAADFEDSNYWDKRKLIRRNK